MSTTTPELLLGWTQPSRDVLRSAVYDDSDDHLVTIAPTGAGKGISSAIPALLSWPGPAIVIDPKGEAFHVTARYRRAIGQQVHLLDPFGVTQHASDALNPLDLLNTDSTCPVDDAHALADLLCDGVRHNLDPYWDDRASALITGLILYTCDEADTLRPPSLSQVRRHINSSNSQHQKLAIDLLAFDHAEYAAAAAILQLNHNTYNGIISTAAAHTSFLRSGPVAQAIRSSTISLDAIRDGAPLALYLVLPPDKLFSHGRLLRLWLGVILSTLTRRRTIPALSTLLLIDEAAQLGYLTQLLTAVTLLRGYGVKVWSFWQDLSQLSALYPRSWQTLLNNCRTQQYFAPASPAAAEQLHDYLAGSQPRSLLHLKPHQTLLSRSGSLPEILHRANYMTDTLYRGRFDPNPYYAKRNNHRSTPPPAPNVIPFKRPIPSPSRRDLGRS
jgi:type IV secretion system protein VirD4